MKTISTVNQSETPDTFTQEQRPAVELKGSVFTLTVLRLQSSDIDAIKAELTTRLAQGPRFFEDAPVVIDLELLRDANVTLDFAHLIHTLKELRLIAVGVRHGTVAQQQTALAHGLAIMKGGAIKDIGAATPPPAAAPRERSARPSVVTPPATLATASAGESSTTKVIYQPIRSGQQIYAKGGDLIVLAAVNAGAEIIADGNIHIYAPLRGRALAGVRGNNSARIFCYNMEAELVAVAGHYRVFEERVPSEFRNKAVQIYLDNEQLKIELLT